MNVTRLSEFVAGMLISDAELRVEYAFPTPETMHERDVLVALAHLLDELQTWRYCWPCTSTQGSQSMENSDEGKPDLSHLRTRIAVSVFRATFLGSLA